MYTFVNLSLCLWIISEALVTQTSCVFSVDSASLLKYVTLWIWDLQDNLRWMLGNLRYSAGFCSSAFHWLHMQVRPAGITVSTAGNWIAFIVTLYIYNLDYYIQNNYKAHSHHVHMYQQHIWSADRRRDRGKYWIVVAEQGCFMGWWHSRLFPYLSHTHIMWKL